MTCLRGTGNLQWQQPGRAGEHDGGRAEVAHAGEGGVPRGGGQLRRRGGGGAVVRRRAVLGHALQPGRGRARPPPRARRHQRARQPARARAQPRRVRAHAGHRAGPRHHGHIVLRAPQYIYFYMLDICIYPLSTSTYLLLHQYICKTSSNHRVIFTTRVRASVKC